MGNNDTSKKRKHKHSEDEDAGSSGSSGSSDDDRRAKKPKKDKEKSKKHKHKHHKHKGGERELLKQAQQFLKQQLKGATAAGDAPAAAPPPAAATGPQAAGPSWLMPPPPPRAPRPPLEVKEPITEAAYFQKNAEFTSWLLEDKRMYFNELAAEEARELFVEFVELWNGGQLGAHLYSGSVEAPKRRTNHVWGFKGATPVANTVPARGPIGVAAFMAEHQQQRESSRASDQQDRRDLRKEREGVLDELLPKATGREAVIEKRAGRREEARARGASPDAHVPGGRGDIMGGDDSFAAAKQREAQAGQFRQGKTAARTAELNYKLVAFQAAEDAKMDQFRALLNQGPITIQKRQPPS